jgi:hypothetical protein
MLCYLFRRLTCRKHDVSKQNLLSTFKSSVIVVANLTIEFIFGRVLSRFLTMFTNWSRLYFVLR